MISRSTCTWQNIFSWSEQASRLFDCASIQTKGRLNYGMRVCIVDLCLAYLIHAVIYCERVSFIIRQLTYFRTLCVVQIGRLPWAQKLSFSIHLWKKELSSKLINNSETCSGFDKFLTLCSRLERGEGGNARKWILGNETWDGKVSFNSIRGDLVWILYSLRLFNFLAV